MQVLVEEYYDRLGNLLCRYENGVRVHGSGSLDENYSFFSTRYLASPDGLRLANYVSGGRFRLLSNKDKALLRALVDEHGAACFVHDTTFKEVMR